MSATVLAQDGEVFFSYSWDNEEHVKSVLLLSNRLRADGIDCVLDQYEVSPPEGWPRWMDRKIASASLVLVVCTETYLNRVMGREVPDAGKGVRWEGGLVYQHIYNAGSENRKFIPIVLHASDLPFIPVPLQGASHFVLDSDDGYDKLHARLLGTPPAEKPPLGQRRAKPRKEVQTDIAALLASPIDTALWNRAKWRGTAFALMPSLPPVLSLVFADKPFAVEIFQGWRDRYGITDAFEELRISIVEGDVPGEDAGYTVTAGLNFEKVFERYSQAGLNMPQSIFEVLVRINRMNPAPDSPYLSLFREAFKQRGEYLLAPAILSPDGRISERLIELGIRKKQIFFRHTSDIGPHDIDSVVLHTGSQHREKSEFGGGTQHA